MSIQVIAGHENQIPKYRLLDYRKSIASALLQIY
jgi:hypothetical protein